MHAEMVFATSVKFDKFDWIFIVNSLELTHKKLNCFLECQKFLVYWGTKTKISG